MKISKYSFLFEIGNADFYVYNTLSNSLFEIDKESYYTLRNFENDSFDSEINLDDNLFNDFLKNGIITESDEDDYLKYKSYITRIRAQRTSMHLTLAPTMDCCFRCYYCFEQYKEKHHMTEEIMDSILKNITSHSNLQDIKITWFGGEPLMAISCMEKFYDKFSAVWEKPFFSNIITTGYHIDEEVVKVLQKIKVSQVQITLDGMKETHNKVKYLPNGEDVFEKVLSNIELLNNLAPEINIVIRVNLTLENKNEFYPLLQLYYNRFAGRKNMGIAPAFVLDRGTSNCDACKLENTLFNHKERSEFILELGRQGIDCVFTRYPDRFFNECAIRNDMAIAFDPEGYAYKCWEVIGNKKYAIGKLDNEGIITDVNEKVLNRQLFGADTIDDPICSSCKYLPICNGGCPIQRIQNKFENGKNNVCTYYKGFLSDFLKIHIARKKAEEVESNH